MPIGLVAFRLKTLEGTFESIKDLDSYWKTEFPKAPNWRTLENTEQIPRLNEIGNASREIRGQHMFSSIAELVTNGERVFAVVGASHVIRQELELRRLLDEFSPYDLGCIWKHQNAFGVKHRKAINWFELTDTGGLDRWPIHICREFWTSNSTSSAAVT